MASEMMNVLKTCSICKQSFSTLRDLIDHEKSHQSDSTASSITSNSKIDGISRNARISDAHSLRNHEKKREFDDVKVKADPNSEKRIRIHNKMPCWPCQKCWSFFHRKRELREHTKQEHTVENLDSSKSKSLGAPAWREPDAIGITDHDDILDGEPTASDPANPGGSTSPIIPAISDPCRISTKLIHETLPSGVPSQDDSTPPPDPHAWVSVKVGTSNSSAEPSARRKDAHYCKYCLAYYYKNIISLKEHQKRLHISDTGQMVYFCSTCDDPWARRKCRTYYPSETALLEHFAKEHEKASNSTSGFCPYCYTNFGDKTKWKAHQKHMHNSMDKNALYYCYKCERRGPVYKKKICKYFPNEQALKEHYETMHGSMCRGANGSNAKNRKKSANDSMDAAHAWTLVKEEIPDVDLDHSSDSLDHRSKRGASTSCHGRISMVSGPRKTAKSLKRLHGKTSGHRKKQKTKKSAKTSDMDAKAAWTIKQEEIPVDTKEQSVTNSTSSHPSTSMALDTGLVKVEITDQGDIHHKSHCDLSVRNIKQEIIVE